MPNIRPRGQNQPTKDSNLAHLTVLEQVNEGIDFKLLTIFSLLFPALTSLQPFNHSYCIKLTDIYYKNYYKNVSTAIKNISL